VESTDASQVNGSGRKHEPLHGLTSAEVLERRSEFGENALPQAKGPSALGILLSQLKSPLVYIILAAAAISLALGELGDFAIIMAVVVIDVVLGFVQEYQAQRTYVALKGLLKPTTTVIRDGTRQELDIRELVPGDLVVLNAGEKVPGDGEIVESTKLALDEAILTGESEPVNKDTAAGQNQVFMGTTAVTGRGIVRVTRTGSRTELGQIATSIGEDLQEETPLQVRLKAFARTLTYLVVGVTLVILVTGILSGRPENMDTMGRVLYTLRVSIILAIAAVPEGLLIAVTVILVLGMRKILKRNGLVKRLLAVETLGSVTVICTDKTGTLTEGRMQVTRSDLVDREHALETMVLCNDLEGPVDVALWAYAHQELQYDPQELADRAERQAEELFSSESKFMATTSCLGDECHNYLKGAPEIVLGMCDVTPEVRQRVLDQVELWAGEGLRLLGLAYRFQGDIEDRSGYTWLGLIAMEDPVRDGVREAVQVAHRAGIQVKMITGDYRRTAEGVARSIGLLADDGEVLEGQELAAMSDEQLQERVGRTVIFSRIRPQDKLRIVRALQANGEITAMVGDGVNDAPALKRANIGVVVGTATDVAKETADLILLDSNFTTIVAAIEEGRVIFENIRKVVAYTLSNSFAEVLTIFGAMMLGWPAPLAVAQILWVHLICDGPSDIVLGFEPKEEGIMEERPKSVKEPILNGLGLSLIGVISVASAIAALIFFGHYYLVHLADYVAYYSTWLPQAAAQEMGRALAIRDGQSYAFATFAVNSMIYIFAYRSMRRSIFRSGKLSQNKPLIWAVLAGLALAIGAIVVPPIRDLLKIDALVPEQWVAIFGVALGLLVVVEIGKAVSKAVSRRRQEARVQRARSL
jgi:Ca2+-transporting ATPase